MSSPCQETISLMHLLLAAGSYWRMNFTKNYLPLIKWVGINYYWLVLIQQFLISISSLELDVATHSFTINLIRLVFLKYEHPSHEFQIAWCSESFLQDMMKLDVKDRVLLRGSRGLPNIHHVDDTTMVDSVHHANASFLL